MSMIRDLNVPECMYGNDDLHHTNEIIELVTLQRVPMKGGAGGGGGGVGGGGVGFSYLWKKCWL